MAQQQKSLTDNSVLDSEKDQEPMGTSHGLQNQRTITDDDNLQKEFDEKMKITTAEDTSEKKAEERPKYKSYIFFDISSTGEFCKKEYDCNISNLRETRDPKDFETDMTDFILKKDVEFPRMAEISLVAIRSKVFKAAMKKMEGKLNAFDKESTKIREGKVTEATMKKRKDEEKRLAEREDFEYVMKVMERVEKELSKLKLDSSKKEEKEELERKRAAMEKTMTKLRREFYMLQIRYAQNSLTLCVNPKVDIKQCKQEDNKNMRPAYKVIYEVLSKYHLRDVDDFSQNWPLIRDFLKKAPKPAVLVAHNGVQLDFKVLYNELLKSSEKLPDNIYYADSLFAFMNLEDKFFTDSIAELAKNKSWDDIRKNEKTIAFKRHFSDAAVASRQALGKWKARRFKLENLYKEIIGGNREFHWSQEDAEATLELAVAYGDKFMDYVDQVAAKFPPIMCSYTSE